MVNQSDLTLAITDLIAADQKEILHCSPGSLRAVMAHARIEAYHNVRRALRSQDASLRSRLSIAPPVGVELEM